jgi:hypothetical protein
VRHGRAADELSPDFPTSTVMSSGNTDSYYDRLAADSADLIAIGAVLGTQDPAYPSSIPQALAERAVGAWRRDEPGEPAAEETSEQARLRAHSGTLAMIGFAVDEQGYTVGKQVTVGLSPDLLAEAIRAADAAP